MNHYRFALLGFGNVGRAFARLLQKKSSELEADYDIQVTVTGIATGRHGIAVDPKGINLDQAISLVEQGQDLSLLSRTPITDPIEFIRSVPADVFFENSPVNHHTGEPAISYLRIALEREMHAITANKGTVVHGYQELTGIALQRKRKFLFESTVMDGAPIFSLFRSALPAARLDSFRGILNSTTNLILGRMETGESFSEAVQYAQEVGLAETDPSNDIDGWDAAIKVSALVTVLMDFPLKPEGVERSGIRDITPEMIEAARSEGKRWKLVCSAQRNGNRVAGHVAPEMVASQSPFYSVDGSSSIVEFHTDTLSSLSIIEGNPGPETTAYGLLADFLNAVRGAG